MKWKTRGFPQFVRDVVQTQAEWDGEGDLPSDEQGPSGSWRFLPDAFHINKKTRTVTALEIVDSHDVDESTAINILGCFWRLDYADFDLRIILSYVRTRRLLIVDNLALFGGRALQLKGRKKPYRDAFNTLKHDFTV